MYETGWKSASGHVIIYSGDDTWGDNSLFFFLKRKKKTLKEACGDIEKRLVVDVICGGKSLFERKSSEELSTAEYSSEIKMPGTVAGHHWWNVLNNVKLGL